MRFVNTRSPLGAVWRSGLGARNGSRTAPTIECWGLYAQDIVMGSAVQVYHYNPYYVTYNDYVPQAATAAINAVNAIDWAAVNYWNGASTYPGFPSSGVNYSAAAIPLTTGTYSWSNLYGALMAAGSTIGSPLQPSWPFPGLVVGRYNPPYIGGQPAWLSPWTPGNPVAWLASAVYFFPGIDVPDNQWGVTQNAQRCRYRLKYPYRYMPGLRLNFYLTIQTMPSGSSTWSDGTTDADLWSFASGGGSQIRLLPTGFSLLAHLSIPNHTTSDLTDVLTDWTEIPLPTPPAVSSTIFGSVNLDIWGMSAAMFGSITGIQL